MSCQTGPDFCLMICKIQEGVKIDTNNVRLVLKVLYQ